MAARRRFRLASLAVIFIVVPLVEIFVLIQVGQVIGVWWTLLLLVVDSLLGSYLVKREGGRAWVALRDALRSYRMPAKELADGVLIVAGGTLLLTPGFATDVVGFFLLLPITRPVARRALTRLVARRLVGEGGASVPGWPSMPGGSTAPGGSGSARSSAPGSSARASGGGDVVPGEVVDGNSDG